MRHVGLIDEFSGLPITEITQEEFKALDEYSTTLPTSPKPGRKWKRLTRGGHWWLGYCYDETATEALLGWRKLVIVDDYAELDAKVLDMLELHQETPLAGLAALVRTHPAATFASLRRLWKSGRVEHRSEGGATWWWRIDGGATA